MSRGKQFSKIPKDKVVERILVTFKTPAGEEAYKKVQEEGNSRPWKERKIAQLICNEKIISNDPMVLEIGIKMYQLAINVDLHGQVIKGLEKFGAVKGQDFDMEVKG